MQQKGLLFVIFILLELAVLVELGRGSSTGAVLAEVFITAFFGYLLVQHVKRTTGIQARLALWTMELPAQGMVRNFMTVVGAVLMIIPGIITDILGILLIFPVTQALVVNRFKKISPQIFKH